MAPSLFQGEGGGEGRGWERKRGGPRGAALHHHNIPSAGQKTAFIRPQVVWVTSNPFNRLQVSSDHRLSPRSLSSA